MASLTWFHTPEALKTIRDFHYEYAREPSEMNEAKERHKEIMEELIDYFKNERKILKRCEFTGSAYEGIKVGGKESELEFDVMFVLNGGNQLRAEKDKRSYRYGHLFPKNYDDQSKFRKLMELASEEIIPKRVRDWFHGEVQLWLNKRTREKPHLRYEVKIKYSGPAVRAVVYRDGQEPYCVDLVPAYEVKNGRTHELYVAKPRSDNHTLWRHSLSVEEKDKLKNIDGPDNGCRKKIIRILKVVRDREPGLDKMYSFYIKNLVIHMTENHVISDWSEKNLAICLHDAMLEMARCMKEGKLYHPCCSSMNVLEDLEEEIRLNISCRFGRIVRSEQEAKKVFGINTFGSMMNSLFGFDKAQSSVKPEDEDTALEPFYNRFDEATSLQPRGGLRQQQAERSDQTGSWRFGVGAAATVIGVGLLGAYGIHKYNQSKKE